MAESQENQSQLKQNVHVKKKDFKDKVEWNRNRKMRVIYRAETFFFNSQMWRTFDPVWSRELALLIKDWLSSDPLLLSRVVIFSPYCLWIFNLNQFFAGVNFPPEIPMKKEDKKLFHTNRRDVLFHLSIKEFIFSSHCLFTQYLLPFQTWRWKSAWKKRGLKNANQNLKIMWTPKMSLISVHLAEYNRINHWLPFGIHFMFLFFVGKKGIKI